MVGTLTPNNMGLTGTDTVSLSSRTSVVRARGEEAEVALIKAGHDAAQLLTRTSRTHSTHVSTQGLDIADSLAQGRLEQVNPAMAKFFSEAAGRIQEHLAMFNAIGGKLGNEATDIAPGAQPTSTVVAQNTTPDKGTKGTGRG